MLRCLRKTPLRMPDGDIDRRWRFCIVFHSIRENSKVFSLQMICLSRAVRQERSPFDSNFWSIFASEKLAKDAGKCQKLIHSEIRLQWLDKGLTHRLQPIQCQCGFSCEFTGPTIVVVSLRVATDTILRVVFHRSSWYQRLAYNLKRRNLNEVQMIGNGLFASSRKSTNQYLGDSWRK